MHLRGYVNGFSNPYLRKVGGLFLDGDYVSVLNRGTLDDMSVLIIARPLVVPLPYYSGGVLFEIEHTPPTKDDIDMEVSKLHTHQYLRRQRIRNQEEDMI